MNCEKCQELLSEFLDGSLGHREHASVSAHLAACPACDATRADFHAIIGAAREARTQLYTPRDERALWLRVRNAVESEGRTAAAAASAPRPGFWSQLLRKRWELSLPQVAAGVAALVVAVSFVTAMGVQFLTSVRGSGAAHSERTVRRAVADEFYPRTYLEPHEASLQYWQQRVEARRASWNPRMRASFDRSVLVLDESVKDSLDDLQKNPHDEMAEEMLNTALRDKVELLREFGEQ
jgi:anti-sigma factor RsiW